MGLASKRGRSHCNGFCIQDGLGPRRVGWKLGEVGLHRECDGSRWVRPGCVRSGFDVAPGWVGWDQSGMGSGPGLGEALDQF